MFFDCRAKYGNRGLTKDREYIPKPFKYGEPPVHDLTGPSSEETCHQRPLFLRRHLYPDKQLPDILPRTPSHRTIVQL